MDNVDGFINYNVVLLLLEQLLTNFSEFCTKIQSLSVKKFI